MFKQIRSTSATHLVIFSIVVFAGMIFCSVHAFAADTLDNTTFVARYEQQAQIEAVLLQKVQSWVKSGVNDSSFLATANTWNQEIAALYVVQEELAGERATLSTSLDVPSDISNLQAKREEVVSAVAQETSNLRSATTSTMKKTLRTQLARDQRALRQLSAHLRRLKQSSARWQTHPYGGGLAQLDSSIIHLQSTLIAYTRAWLSGQTPS